MAINVGTIGYGYWGPNVARNFATQTDCRLTAIADGSPQARARAQLQHPGVQTIADAGGEHGQVQRARAAVHADGVLDAAVLGEIALEILDGRTEDELRVGDDVGDGAIDFVLDAAVLRFEVQKRDQMFSFKRMSSRAGARDLERAGGAPPIPPGPSLPLGVTPAIIRPSTARRFGRGP